MKFELGARGEGYTVYELVFTDGTIEIGLSDVHKRYLLYLASRGGETDVDYGLLEGGMITSEQTKHIDELVEPLRCVSKRKIVGYQRMYRHKLTDIGWNVVNALKADTDHMVSVVKKEIV